MGERGSEITITMAHDPPPILPTRRPFLPEVCVLFCAVLCAIPLSCSLVATQPTRAYVTKTLSLLLCAGPI